jgi:tetratricopeptide (TPR) repeat protein
MAEHASTTETDDGLADQAPPREHDEVARVGRYVLLERIGAGGVGIVYAAWDPVLSRRIALKLLRTGGAEQGQLRLVREAQAMARLSHPNVVPVFDAGIVDGRAFVAMDFVEGGTLRAWLREQHPRDEVLDAFVQAARGLVAAHAAALVHRDFKPDNVLLGRLADGRVRAMVADFGLVRVDGDGPEPAGDAVANADGLATASGSGRLTTTGMVMGTPAYMPPEQFLTPSRGGRGVDAKSDQFSFCVALYEALYGDRPFPGNDARSLALAVMQGKRAPIPAGASVPAALAKVVERGLAIDPAARHESMEALLDALSRARRGRRLGRVALVAVPVALAIAWLARPSTEAAVAPCEGTDAPLRARWGDEHRASIADAFARTQLAYAGEAAAATVRELDAWAAAWSSARVDACEATAVRREQSAELLDLRMACLDRRLTGFAAAVDVLVAADAKAVERATSLATILPDLRPCNDAAALLSRIPPPDAAQTAVVAELRDAIDRARADVSLGRTAAACAALAELSTRAAELGYAPVHAEVELARGGCELDASQASSRDTLERAVLLAIESHDSASAAEAARMVAFVVGVRNGDHAEGRRQARLARALATDATAPRTDARLWLTEAQIEFSAGEYPAARQRIARAREIGLPVFGERSAWVAGLENSAGAIELRAGNYAAAQQTFERALAIAEHAHGPRHPDVALPLNNLALALERQARYAEAIAMLERAHDVLAAAHGGTDPRVGQFLHNLGGMYLHSGDAETAVGFLEQGIAVIDAALGPEHATAAGAWTMLGEASLELGRREAARRAFDRALAIREHAAGRDHPALSLVLVGIARLELAEGRREAAREAIDRARALVEGHEIDPEDRGMLAFVDAQVLDDGGRRDDAIARADEAARAFEAAGPTGARGLARLQAWRAELGR